MERKASAVWKGGLKDGTGRFSADSGVFQETPYNFRNRFESEPGTNPEELIAAAHASCFSMALSGQLGERGLTAEEIRTVATVTLEKTENGFGVTKSHLDVNALIPGADEDAFRQAAEAAKAGCPISKLLNAEITMSAKLG
jgi:lipoyl-dependent peroxiredoxin